jgi:head-tail adaptor
MMRQHVTVLRAGRSLDRYNVESANWATATSETVRGFLAPRSLIAQAEEIKSRDQVAGEAFVFLPYRTSVTATDRLLINGATYEIVGEPAVFQKRFILCIVRTTKG